jgi:hypothetical protein
MEWADRSMLLSRGAVISRRYGARPGLCGRLLQAMLQCSGSAYLKRARKLLKTGPGRPADLRKREKGGAATIIACDCCQLCANDAGTRTGRVGVRRLPSVRAIPRTDMEPSLERWGYHETHIGAQKETNWP